MLDNFPSVDFITVLRSPAEGLHLTRRSITQFSEAYGSGIVSWIVINGGTDNYIQAEVELARSSISGTVEHIIESDTGIYAAMNKGLARVRGNYFVMLNAGDMTSVDLIKFLPQLHTDNVSCFLSKWHGVDGSAIEKKLYRQREFRPSLGRMPNHQAMVFPQSFAMYVYDTNFPISADQDLKLRLWKEGKLFQINEFTTSSLTCGLSTRKLTLVQVLSRLAESRAIFRKNFNVVHAEFLSLIYGARYLTRMF